MFENFMEFRKTEDVENIENFDFKEKNEIKKIYPHGYHQYDKKGRPIYIEIISKCDIDGVLKLTNEERFKKYYIKEYERTLLYRFPCCGLKHNKIIEQSCTIICAKGLGLSMLTGKTKSFMRIASDIGQDYYPEMLGNLYIINSGFFFNAVWSIVKSFIDEKTAKKVTILGSDYLKELTKFIDMNNFPKLLGGNCECLTVEGGCLFSDIGPWNPEGKPNQFYDSKLFDNVK